MAPSRSLKALSVLALLTLGAGCAAPTDDTEAEASEQGVTSSEDASKLLDLPFYFSVPKGAVNTEINRRAYSYPTVWNESKEVKNAGLRMIAIRQAGTSPAQKRAARLDMSEQLARAGVLQDGDVALTFRPELAGTMAYPHIQMGITHASLVYTKGGKAFNVDSPLDGEYVGQFSTLHFTGGTTSSGTVDAGTDALHIIRPVGWDDARRERLRGWATAVAGNRANGKVRFQKDYLTPIFASQRMTTRQTVTQLGKNILGTNTKDLPMYCSEFAWHMLALSNCTEAQIRDAGAEGAACVDEVFEPMQLAATGPDKLGLAEGPLLSLMQAPADQRLALVGPVFATGANGGRLSSGHRAVAEQVAPLMAGLSQYYGARVQGAPAEMVYGAAGQLNAGVQNVPNYSPTAFLVNTMKESGRKLDYVATVVFMDRQADMDKAKRLAMPSGTSIPQ